VSAVRVVEDCNVTEVAGTPAIVTVAPDAKLLPVSVTRVPPEVVPASGAMEVTRGG